MNGSTRTGLPAQVKVATPRPPDVPLGDADVRRDRVSDLTEEELELLAERLYPHLEDIPYKRDPFRVRPK
jgi:hypothetical protein